MPGQVRAKLPVPGFVCASDPNATAALVPRPDQLPRDHRRLARRAITAFRRGRVITLQDVEATDGLSYTAAFSERLVGDNQTNHPSLVQLSVVPGPLSGIVFHRRTRAMPHGVGMPAHRGTGPTTVIHFTTMPLVPNQKPSLLAFDGQVGVYGCFERTRPAASTY